MKYKKYLLFFFAIFAVAFVSFAEENSDVEKIDWKNLPPPPMPPMPTDHLPLFDLIVQANEITEFETVIILKNTNIVNTVSFARFQRQQNIRNNLSGNIDTVKVDNKIYYYRRNISEKRNLLKTERFNSQNLLIESIRFGSDSLISTKTFFDYDENGLLLSERMYNFWCCGDSNSILEVKVLYKYKNGRLVERNHVRISPHTYFKRLTNQYYNELGKIIKVEIFIVDEYGNVVWKSIRDFKYNEKGNIEKLADYTPFDDTVINEKFTFKYVDNRIITYKSIDNQPKERHYEFILK